MIIIQDTALVAVLNMKGFKFSYMEMSEFGNKVNFIYIDNKNKDVEHIKSSFYNNKCKINDAFGFSLEEHKVRTQMRQYFENEKNKKIIKKEVVPQRKNPPTLAEKIGTWKPFQALLNN